MLLLGIPFHASEIYRLSGGWHVDSPEDSFAVTLLGCAVHVFRMPAFFMLAGFFAAMMLERRGDAAWLRERCVRLGVPLVFTLLAFGWLEAAIPDMRALGIVPAIERAFAAGPASWSHHRWFLVVLLLYCFSAVAARRWWGGAGPWFRRVVLGPLLPVLLVALPFAIGGIGLATGAGGLGLDGTPAYDNFYFRYAVFFAVGYAVHRMDGTWERFLRFGLVDVALATVAIALFAFTYEGFDVAHPDARITLTRGAVDLLAGYYASKAFFVGARRWMGVRASPVRYLVDASLCIYLVHFVFVLGFGALLLRVGWLPVVELILICAGTSAASVGVYEVVRRSRVSGALLGVRVGGARRAFPRGSG